MMPGRSDLGVLSTRRMFKLLLICASYTGCVILIFLGRRHLNSGTIKFNRTSQVGFPTQDNSIERNTTQTNQLALKNVGDLDMNLKEKDSGNTAIDNKYLFLISCGLLLYFSALIYIYKQWKEPLPTRTHINGHQFKV